MSSTGLNPSSYDSKTELPDFAAPFWLPEGPSIQAPTWLSVIGRDGYWPLAVLNAASSLKDEHLNRPDPRDNSSTLPPPPSTLVKIEANVHYDLLNTPLPELSRVILFNVPLPLQVSVLCALLLLFYQSFGICRGSLYTSSGLFALFRHNLTSAQAILLGINSGFATAIMVQLLWVALTPADAFIEGIVTFRWLTGIMILSMATLIAIVMFFFTDTPRCRDGLTLTKDERHKERLRLGSLIFGFFTLVLCLLTVGPYFFFYQYQLRSN